MGYIACEAHLSINKYTQEGKTMNDNSRIFMKSIVKISLRESRRGPTKTQVPLYTVGCFGRFRETTRYDRRRFPCGSHGSVSRVTVRMVPTARFHEPRFGFTNPCPASMPRSVSNGSVRTVLFTRFGSHGSKWNRKSQIGSRSNV